MTRVIAGTAGGRQLAVPAGRDTRPTSDRAREGLFATVQALHGPLDGASVLDLYAGSGAVGLEALSRGAERAVLVEADARAVRVIRANVDALGLPGAHVVAGRVEQVLARGPAAVVSQGSGVGQREVAETGDPAEAGDSPGGAAAGGGFDVVFADPPYAVRGDVVGAVLKLLVEESWVAAGALVVVERSTRSGEVCWPEGYVWDRSRKYGEATLWYGHATGAAGLI
jgi:16S rRNA (guanine966-N2)-methyltransferase